MKAASYINQSPKMVEKVNLVPYGKLGFSVVRTMEPVPVVPVQPIPVIAAQPKPVPASYPKPFLLVANPPPNTANPPIPAAIPSISPMGMPLTLAPDPLMYAADRLRYVSHMRQARLDMRLKLAHETRRFISRKPKPPPKRIPIEISRRLAGLPEPTRPEPESCECCGARPKGRLALDHCHTTGAFRGWLCGKCNLSIGCLGDTIEALERALAYLKRAYSHQQTCVSEHAEP